MDQEGKVLDEAAFINTNEDLAYLIERIKLYGDARAVLEASVFTVSAAMTATMSCLVNYRISLYRREGHGTITRLMSPQATD